MIIENEQYYFLLDINIWRVIYFSKYSQNEFFFFRRICANSSINLRERRQDLYSYKFWMLPAILILRTNKITFNYTIFIRLQITSTHSLAMKTILGIYEPTEFLSGLTSSSSSSSSSKEHIITWTISILIFFFSYSLCQFIDYIYICIDTVKDVQINFFIRSNKNV